MSNYDKKEIKPYIENNADLIPIHVWNKMIKGKVRGKTPAHNDWTTRAYKNDKETINNWVDKGLNLGYRIPANELIVDMDPRNYEGLDCEELIAELFGYFDWEELIADLPTVKTGGGGYHVYCLLPEDCDYTLLKETLEEYPGVEFKRKGRQVLCAGSKHPSGNYYKWINKSEGGIVPKSVLEVIKRERNKSGDYSSGQACLNGTQLEELILDNLNIDDYYTNDKWFPLMCAAHHATGGTGVEEFSEWSIEALGYEDDSNIIKQRWESLNDKENSITVGTLIKELENKGQDTNNVKAVLAFANQPELELEEDDSEESQMVNEANEIASDIDIDDMYHTPQGEAGVEGAALMASKDLSPVSSQEDIMKAIRLIKAADSFESMKAQELLISNKVLKQASLNKILKQLDAKIADDLALMLSQKTLEKTFNKGKHLMCPPNGQLHAFHKTHWRPLSDEFLGKLIQNVLWKIKEKVNIEMQELSLLNQAVKLSRIQVATLTDKLHSTELPQSVVNCQNGELWLMRDGTHALRPHSYKSYLLNCLNVEYDPSAECPLFMQTIEEIFGDFMDGEDIARHVGELMGYMIQPYKNIASWWLFRGPGGDGKSTLIKILEAVLHDAQIASTVKLLSAASSGGDNHGMTSLVGALSVVIEELPANYLLKDEGVKLLSENTKMECNPKGRDKFNFMYGGNLIMCSNGFPATRDLSHGMIRRANVIPFNKQFTKEDAFGNNKADIDRLDNIIRNPKEMAGILNFMLEGLQRLRSRGRFKIPDSCAEAKEEWLGQANNVVRFLKETVEKSIGSVECMCDLNTFYGMHYYTWCDNNGIEEKMRKKKQHFIKDMENLGYVIKRGGGNVMKVYGGRILASAEEMIDNIDDF